jgi:branched-chain amino acid transport system substrate-binding protein
LIIEDNQSDFKQTAAAINKLASVDKVQVIIGPNWTEFSEIAAPIANLNKVIMITVSGITPTMTQGRKFVFTTEPAHSAMSAPLTQQIIKNKHSKISLITSITAYFEALSGAIREDLKNAGINLFSDETALPENLDFRSYLAKQKAAKTDALIVMLNEGGALHAFLKQAHELKIEAKIYASNAVLFDPVIGKEMHLANDVTIFNLRTIASTNFLNRFLKEFGAPAADAAPRAYDAMYAVADSYRRCGITETEKLAECLNKIDLKLQTGRLRFDSNNMAIISGAVSSAYLMRNGVPIPIN